jgi:hypothetical protein
MLPEWVCSGPAAIRGSQERLTVGFMFFLACMLSVSVNAHGEEFPWTTELLSDLHDHSLMAFETAEKLGRKVIGLAPVLQYSSSLELAGVGLKPAKYWFGIRLPKNLSKLPTAYPALKPDDFIRCRGLWVMPLGAAIDIPLRRGSALTIAFAMNIGGQTPFENFLPGVTVVFQFPP